MSLENKNTVRRFYEEVLSQGALDAIDELCSSPYKGTEGWHYTDGSARHARGPAR